MTREQKMKLAVEKKYGKRSKEYGYFCWVFSRRGADQLEWLYNKLMK